MKIRKYYKSPYKIITKVEIEVAPWIIYSLDFSSMNTFLKY